MSFATDSITFSADGVDDSTPAAQAISGTFSVDAVYVAVLTEGSAIERVTHSLSGKTATISVYPKSPAALGAGMHSSRITVFGQVCADAGCTRLASGPSRSIEVLYPVPQVIREISPYVAQEQTAGRATIRGMGFQKVKVQGVSFGGIPAASFSVTSDTQIDATYPPLGYGRYDIQLQVATAAVPARSDAKLVVVPSPVFVPYAMHYPTLNPAVSKVVYDTERDALLVVTNQNGAGELFRFQHAGESWSVAETVSIPTPHDIALSANGRFLFAVTDRNVVQLEADTLVQSAAWTAPLSNGTTLTGIVVGNDGKAILTTTAGPNATSPVYSFDPRTGTFTSSDALNNAAPFASGNGALLLVSQQDAAATTGLPLNQIATNGTLSTTGLSFSRNTVASVIDRFSTRVALNGRAVYSSGFSLIGALPETTLATAFSPDGTRLYAYDSAAATVLVYDAATVVASGSTLNVIDSALNVSADPGTNPQMTISAVGDALFLAGPENLLVIPVVQQ